MRATRDLPGRVVAEEGDVLADLVTLLLNDALRYPHQVPDFLIVRGEGPKGITENGRNGQAMGITSPNLGQYRYRGMTAPPEHARSFALKERAINYQISGSNVPGLFLTCDANLRASPQKTGATLRMPGIHTLPHTA